jgi:hypothetical protein
MRTVAVALVSVAAVAPGRAGTPTWSFRTPGDAAYCRIEFPRSLFALRCMSPSTGFWLRLTVPNQGGGPVRVEKGSDVRFLAYREHRVPLLPFGREFASSDALIFTCRSRRDGVACKHYDGLAFWLGRTGAYRIYYDKPGFRPHVRPLFRAHGLWCGIDLDTLEPDVPVLTCWRAADGLLMTLGPGASGSHVSYTRSEQALDFRPPGFPTLRTGRASSWRCRKVDQMFAERCSARAGISVFTCRSSEIRVTCRNRAGGGFWASRAAFATF